ncbi:response regulator transcription factor [bacterium]|nr:response regulator transcription factor [bacterium]
MIRILLAEDHVILREGLAQMLDREEGMEVVGQATDGREALGLVHDLEPDLVIMDIGMQNLNGLDATLRIKQANPSVHIIMLTQHEAEEYIFRAFENGAMGYLIKKTALKNLVSAIHAVMKGQYYISPSISEAFVTSFLAQQRSSKTVKNVKQLTEREREILQLIAEGKSTKIISNILNISIKTVESHRGNIMNKLKMHSIAELTRYAITTGLIHLEDPLPQ